MIGAAGAGASIEREALYRLGDVQEAEQHLLGALMMSNAGLDRDSVVALRPEHFVSQEHGRIFVAIRALAQRGQVADAMTLAVYFKDSADLERVGGARKYLAALMAVGSALAIDNLAKLIREMALRRLLVDAGARIIGEAGEPDPGRPIEDVVARCEQFIAAAAEGSAIDDRMVHVVDAADRALARAQTAMRGGAAPVGVTTGVAAVDAYTGGLHRTELVICAGRPGMGKTAKLGTVILASGMKGVPSLTFSLEMSSDEISARLLAQMTGISADRQRRGQIDDHDIAVLVDARGRLAEMPIYIDDTAAITVPFMRARARRLLRRTTIGLICVDYLQLLRGTGRAENRVSEVSEISRGLKALAKEFDVPVFALSQLNRAVEQREQKRPLLSDLRESGSIEQDADAVWFLFREEYYRQQEEPQEKSGEDSSDFRVRRSRWLTQLDGCRGQAEIIIAKHRHGPPSTIRVRFDGERSQFTDLRA